MRQGGVVVAAHGIELEQRVEVHELYAGNVIDSFFVDTLFEILLHASEGVRVAVGDGVTQRCAVIADEHEIDAPGIDTDGGELDAALCSQLQSADHLVVEGEDIPVEMSASVYEIVVEACELFE